MDRKWSLYSIFRFLVIIISIQYFLKPKRTALITPASQITEVAIKCIRTEQF